MTKIIFVRHAEAEGNVTQTLHGWTDSKLTEKGISQAKKVAQRFKSEKIDVIYSSDLKRAYNTAELIADAKQLDINIDEGLREINCGDFEDKPFNYLEEIYPENMYNFNNQLHLFTCPNGESAVEFQNRLVESVNNIILNNADKNICIVTHGTAIRVILCYFYSKPLEEVVNIFWGDNTSISVVIIDEDKYYVEVESDATHLGEEMSTILSQDWYKKLKGEEE